MYFIATEKGKDLMLNVCRSITLGARLFSTELSNFISFVALYRLLCVLFIFNKETITRVQTSIAYTDNSSAEVLTYFFGDTCIQMKLYVYNLVNTNLSYLTEGAFSVIKNEKILCKLFAWTGVV